LDGLIRHALLFCKTPETYVDKLYDDLVFHDHAAKYYGRFFDLLLEADERAVLWHCSVGKDRVGIGTALLLTALGVERRTIYDDYIKTNDYITDNARQVAGLAVKKTGNSELAECIQVLLTVSEDYLIHAFEAMEKSFGSIDGYLRERIGITKDKRELLKRKYLTD
jgi:protein-tyrosine phosphatase